MRRRARILLGCGARRLRRLADALRSDLEGRDVMVAGRVTALPQLLDEGVRFHFELASPPRVPRHLLLSWYRPRDGMAALPVVRAGEAWRFSVRLKRPHGQANPGGFDYGGLAPRAGCPRHRACARIGRAAGWSPDRPCSGFIG
ncbi:ComEC/Rec2 family competence protein [Thauera humireducens]|uniref:ComEC/Rec2 family competence protein n=1 Tax=Thauera humireducens TaxID=1134435 RepID=UPI00311FBA16